MKIMVRTVGREGRQGKITAMTVEDVLLICPINVGFDADGYAKL